MIETAIDYACAASRRLTRYPLLKMFKPRQRKHYVYLSSNGRKTIVSASRRNIDDMTLMGFAKKGRYELP